MALGVPLHLTAANVAALRASQLRVVVTGPTGWLGRATLAMLDDALTDCELAQLVLVFGSSARHIRLPSGREIPCRALEDLPTTDVADCLILHFAYLTKDKIALTSVDDYIRLNNAIHDLVAGAVVAWRPPGLFFASSGAVCQNRSADGRPDKQANLYGWMKAVHDDSFASATAGSETTYVCGRIFSLAGEYMNKATLYALGSILTALRAGQPVVLHANREVWRSYAYVGDAVNLVLALLLAKQSVHALDMAGDEIVEIGALAALCAEVTGRGDAIISRPPISVDAPDRMIGDFAPFYRLMRREGIEPLSLREQIRVTARYFDGVARGSAADDMSPRRNDDGSASARRCFP